MFMSKPQVINTLPQNYSTNVDVKSLINIFFNTDIDRNHIADSVFVTDNNGLKVDVNLSYDNRVITINPQPTFAPGTTFNIVLIGGKTADGLHPAGIRTILGEAMDSNYQFGFTTVASTSLNAPTPLAPENQVIIKQQPQFQWQPIVGATGYQIKVSSSNTLTPVVWPADSDTFILNSPGPITPSYQFPDGTYYWTVRAVDSTGRPGNWSPVHVFNKDSRTQGTQASGDTVAPDAVPFYAEQALIPLEMLDSFPSQGESNIGVNLQNIYIHLSGHFTQDQITKDMFSITGKNVDGIHNNPDFPEHGKVSVVDAIVIPQSDGTTTIKLVLGVIPSQAYIPQLP